MSDDNEYPHNNEWRVSMGFDPIELPHEFMSVYGDPVTEHDVKATFPNQKNKKLKRNISPDKVTRTKTKIPTNPPSNPVSVFIEQTKKTDQHTLTQLFRRQSAQEFEDSESDPDFVTKKTRRKRESDPIVSPNSREIKRNAVKKRRKRDSDLAQLGDLVTSTAKELRHPSYLSGQIDPGYILFGVVKGGDRDTVMVGWNKPERVFLQDKGWANDEMKITEYADRTLVRVIAKNTDQELAKMNIFLRAAIYHEFHFKRGIGWKKHDWV